MSTTEPIETEFTIFKSRFMSALEALKRYMSEEKRDEFQTVIDNISEAIKVGEKINVAELVADLMNPKKFGLPQEIIEEFLSYIVGDEAGGESIISGTIEQAKKIIWSKSKQKS
ncbi:MAG: hypothetical protein QXE70_04415 [Ignisphaera sp.]|uniref:Uncharacterized protein n=1 Tax=Ignisphaera aggregans TaxID=334771 RepID=A0A7C4D123_9CREN